MLTSSCFFFFNDTATTEIYTLSLHDALPIFERMPLVADRANGAGPLGHGLPVYLEDRKSTRLNSSHSQISYAVFCLKKKNEYTRCPDLTTHAGHILLSSRMRDIDRSSTLASV